DVLELAAKIVGEAFVQLVLIEVGRLVAELVFVARRQLAVVLVREVGEGALDPLALRPQQLPCPFRIHRSPAYNEDLAKQRLSRRAALLAPRRRPQSRPYLVDMGAPCVLASERPSRPDSERRIARPSQPSTSRASSAITITAA